MRNSMLSAMLATTVLCGCGGAPAPDGDSGSGPVSAFPTRLIQRQAVDHLDEPAREPMVVAHPGGTLFVAGYGPQPDPRSQPQLWRSSDDGASWERVDVGAPEDGARGNSDVDLAMGPEGTLYFITMGFSWKTFEGTHIAIGTSQDLGASWTWTSLSEDRYDDRPWVEVAPDGTAHAIWNDGAGVNHAVSRDRGRTWEEWARIHPAGGSSHLAIGPDGQLAVRIVPMSASGQRFDDGVELIAVSTDGGRNWLTHDAPGTRDWDSTGGDATKVPRWVEPVAWDADGSLYHLWSEGDDLVLGRSSDRGATWDRWIVANDGEMASFPYLIARGSGELAATWFTGRGESLMVNVACIQAPSTGAGEPLIARAMPFQQDAWVEREGAVVRDTAGEYLPLIFLDDGELGVVTTLQDLRGNPQRGIELHGDRQGFTWRTFGGRVS